MKNKETLEEFTENYLNKFYSNYAFKDLLKPLLIDGAKWQAERMYSEEDIKQLFKSIISEIEIRKQNIISNSKNITTHLLEGGCIAFESSQDIIKEQFEQFKKK